MATSKLPIQFNTKAGSAILNRTKQRRRRLQKQVNASSQVNTGVTLATEIEGAIAALALGVSEGIAHATHGRPTYYGEPCQPIIFINRYAELEGIKLDDSNAKEGYAGDERRRITGFSRMFNNHFTDVYATSLGAYSRAGYPDYFRDLVEQADPFDPNKISASAVTFTNVYSMLPRYIKPGISALSDHEMIASHAMLRGENFMLTHIALDGELNFEEQRLGFLAQNTVITAGSETPDVTYLGNRFGKLKEANDTLQLVIDASANLDEFPGWAYSKGDVPAKQRISSALPPIVVDVTSIYALYKRAGLLEFTTTGAAAGFEGKTLSAILDNEYFTTPLTRPRLEGLLETTREYHPARFKSRDHLQYAGIPKYIDVLIEAGITRPDRLDKDFPVTGEDYKSGFSFGRIVSLEPAELPQFSIPYNEVAAAARQKVGEEDIRILKACYGPAVLPSLF